MKNYIFNFKTFVSVLFMLFVGCTLSFAASDYNRNISLSEDEVREDVEGTSFNNVAVTKEYETVPNLEMAGCACSDECVCRRKCKFGKCYVDPKVFSITGNELKKSEMAKYDESGVAYDDYDKIYHITGNGEKRHRCKMVKVFDIDGTEREKAVEAKKNKKAYNIN